MLRKPVIVVGVAGVLLAVSVIGILLVTGASGGGHTSKPLVASLASSRGTPPPAAGTPAAFVYLAGQKSNRCGLTSGELQSYPSTQRLQGSCCFPMELSTYEWQVPALHRYASIPQIPADPYDVSVSLAQRLLGYDTSIQLSPAEQSTYDKAMRMSRLRGPCCCRCWRWTAFRGLSKFLITQRSWPARRLAVLIDDLEGCGGKDSAPTGNKI